MWVSCVLTITHETKMGQDFSVEDFRHFQGFHGINLRSGLDRCYDKVDSQLEHLVEYVTERLKSPVKTPEPPLERRVHYSKRRTRCGAPSVNRRSFSDEECEKFQRENDGFPLPSTDDEVRHFDEEVFVGSEVPRVEIMPSPRCHRSRSGSVPEFRTMSCAVLKAKLQKVSAPSKPKFLEKLITGVGLSRRSDDKESRNGLISHDEHSHTKEHGIQSSVGDCDSVGPNVFHSVRPDTRLLHKSERFQFTGSEKFYVNHAGILNIEGAEGLSTTSCDSDFFDSAGDECSSEGSITPTNSSPNHRSPSVTPKQTWSTPTSPLISGFVKQQCVNFHKLCSETHENARYSREASRAKTARTQSAPTSPCIESKSFCTYRYQRHRIDKCNQVLKAYYSISRDERFAKSVMSKGYVKALVEQLDRSKMGKKDESVKNSGSSSPIAGRAKQDSEDGLCPPVGQYRNTPSPSLGLPRTVGPKPAIDRSTKPNLSVSTSKEHNNNSDTKKSSSATNSNVNTEALTPSQRSRDKNAGLENVEIRNSTEVVSGYGVAGPPPMSPAELFDSSWSESDTSFDDFSDTDIEAEYQLALKETETDPVPCEAGPDPEESKPQDKLYRIADELYRTEKDYVKRLHLLHQVFHFRIKMKNRQENFLPDDVITKMFSNIESIYQFHNDFLLPQLEDRMKKWSTQPHIGDLMRRNAPFLKLYTDYVKNFDNAMNLINTWQQKSTKFTAVIEEIQKEPECGSLTLQHHMLGPIQRVPRYELLLKDYIKRLPPDSPDHQDSQAALELVTTAAKHSNEAMKKIEKFEKLLEIHQRLRGINIDFISPTRELLREGPITKISARSGEKQIRYMFLFNDMLLICSELLLKTYKVRSQLDIDGMELQTGENSSIPNTFCVLSKQKVIELLDHEDQAGDKLTWKESINKAIVDLDHKKKQLLKNREELTNSLDPTLPDSCLGRRAPCWVADDQATYCMRCDKGFSTLRRRHHCRACGWVICNKCCRRAPLAYLDNKIDRVCTKCYSVLVCTSESTEPTHKGSSKPANCVLQVEASHPAVLSGYLSMSPDKGRTWMKRWFSVHEDFVMYSFKGNQDKSALSSLPLPGYTAEAASPKDTDKSHVFKLRHKDKKIILYQTDNEKQMRKWVSVLEKLVKLELPDETQRLSSQSSASNSSSTDTTDDSSDVATMATSVANGSSSTAHVTDNNKTCKDGYANITVADTVRSVHS